MLLKTGRTFCPNTHAVRSDIKYIGLILNISWNIQRSSQKAFAKALILKPLDDVSSEAGSSDWNEYKEHVILTNRKSYDEDTQTTVIKRTRKKEQTRLSEYGEKE